MKVKFSFDRVAVEQRGYTVQNVHRTVKELISFHDLPCVSDGAVLAFKDKDHGAGFAIMWDIILSLLHAEWFIDCAVSYIWQDEDGEEDVSVQARKV